MEQDAYDLGTDDYIDEADIISSAKLGNDRKRELLSQHFARTASNGNAPALERMWEACLGQQWVDIDYRDDQGSTPLICASCFGHTRVAELLLEYGANVNSQDNSGWTALMWATTNHNQNLVRVLLEHGASSSAKTARGHTAFNIASSNLSSGSDSEGCRRSPGAGESGSARSGAGSRMSNDNDALSVSSPRSMEHSAMGTPSRHTHGRDAFVAGQSVLSMLQASSARAGTKAPEMPAGGSGLLSPTRSADGSRLAGEGLGLTLGYGDECGPGLPAGDTADTVAGGGIGGLVGGMDGLGIDEGDGAPQTFDWDSLQLDQMYVISPATVPQFLHAVVKEIRPTRWLRREVQREHRFVAASMIFLAARFAHHLGTADFLESFLADALAAIIHEVQTRKSDPVGLAFWMGNIHALIYFFKRDSTLVQITSDAQGRMSECLHDAYGLLVRAVEAELEPLIDTALLAYEAMPEMFGDVKFESDKGQRLSMFFFGGQADSARKSADGRPLRRSQVTLKPGRPRRSSILAIAPKPAGPATAVGEAPAWISAVQYAHGRAADMNGPVPATAAAAATKRASSGDTYVSDRPSGDHTHPVTALFCTPSPRTVTFMLERLLDLLQMCEIHPSIVWGVIQQLFCYLGHESFNRVLTTREFCSRSRAMQIRMNLSQLSEWVRQSAGRLPVPHQSDAAADGAASPRKAVGAQTAEALLYRAHFDPLVELVELLQCLTHLPDLAEFFETTAKMKHLNVLQQETAAMNYRYEVQETRIAPDIAEYLESVAKEIREGQRAEREKQSMERASRRSTVTVVSERRTMDGRPSMLSLDLTQHVSRTSSGVVRVLADPAGGAGAMHTLEPADRRSGNISPPPSAGGGTVCSRHRAGGQRSVRRGLLIPIARPNVRPSVRTLFPGQAVSSGRSSIGSRVSESLEPISEVSSVTSRQRSRTAVDCEDEPGGDARSVGSADQRLSSDAFAMSSPPPPRAQQPLPLAVAPWSLSPPPPPLVPNTAPIDSGWGSAESGDGMLSASLRGPRGKKCLPEHMRELLDASELLPFAVPTSREWLVWWMSHPRTRAQAQAPASDWSDETVACHRQQELAATTDKAAPPALSELVPAVPSEFLHDLSQIA
ncbi:hypothetical protein LPJ61_003731 [Coemansia biformis]|uniref:Dilute domain-containing protein n=1 Tax=Coemansia biformis TaxID=1286918 RepID=A0A9W8CW04_9FUNG|nr:hypothetical protein LPJ61_003731 [Coemansia biformis]